MRKEQCGFCGTTFKPRFLWQMECEACLMRLVAIGVGMVKSGQAALGLTPRSAPADATPASS